MKRDSRLLHPGWEKRYRGSRKTKPRRRLWNRIRQTIITKASRDYGGTTKDPRMKKSLGLTKDPVR